MKKVALNFSNHSIGGGLQISKWFLTRLANDRNFWSKYKLRILLSKSIYEWCLSNNIGFEAKILVLDSSPLRSITSRNKAASFIRNSDLLFTLLGPSGIPSKSEVSGLANAWVSCAPFGQYFKTYGISAPLYIAKYVAHGISLRSCERLYFETKLSRDNYCKRFFYDKSLTNVIPNTVNDMVYSSDVIHEANTRFSVIYLTSYHKHKNLESLGPIIDLLLKRGRMQDFVFTLTLSSNEFRKLCDKLVKINPIIPLYLENLGRVEPDLLATVYKRSNVCISLSEMETFSACYAEALFFNVPIIVLDKPFSRNICGDFANFVDIDDIEGICRAIETLNISGELEPKYSFSDYFISPDARYDKLKAFIESSLEDV